MPRDTRHRQPLKASSQCEPLPHASEQSFAERVVQWQREHGRNHLPWQASADPYRVWLSEIMLQQTQVATVLRYFERFVERFDNVAALAAASQDDVLALWSGLGYYSRARNLHRCAQHVVALHAGAFPSDAETLATLPGIGRSTAAAIASICFHERVAILDANVRRVVSRYTGFDQDLAQPVNERALWQRATSLLPAADSPEYPSRAKAMPRYTQALMDLGASLCSPKAPKCLLCPVQAQCQAFQKGVAEQLPVRSRKVKRSALSVWLLLARTPEGGVLLAQRPSPGVWAGLYCLPWFDSDPALRAALPAHLRQHVQAGDVLLHVLTHKDLHLHFLHLEVPQALALADGVGLAAPFASMGAWVAPQAWRGKGLPAPVRKYLEQHMEPQQARSLSAPGR